MSLLLPKLRLAAFILATILSVVVLGLSARILTSQNDSDLYLGYFGFAGIGVATAILTLLTLPVMLFLEASNELTPVSFIIVEFICTFILWILWVATAGIASTDVSLLFPVSCGVYAEYFGPDDSPFVQGICQETIAAEAFSWFAWIILFGYSNTLLIFTLMAWSRTGAKKAWFSSARHVALLGKEGASATEMRARKVNDQV